MQEHEQPANTKIKRTGGFAKFVRALGLLGVLAGAAALFVWRMQEVRKEFEAQDKLNTARRGDFSKLPEDVKTEGHRSTPQPKAHPMPVRGDFDRDTLKALTGDELLRLSDDPVDALDISTEYDGDRDWGEEIDAISVGETPDPLSDPYDGRTYRKFDLRGMASDLQGSDREAYLAVVDVIDEADGLLSSSKQLEGVRRTDALQRAEDAFRRAKGELEPLAEKLPDVDAIKRAQEWITQGIYQSQKTRVE